MMDILKQTSQILNQVNELINQLSDEQYSSPVSVLSNNSIGKHIRHIVEFYQCLFNGLPAGYIDYDKRQRSLLLETNKNYTQEAIKSLMSYMENVQDNSLLLNVSFEEKSSVINTSIFRELAYNIEHTVHHLAIIKIGIKTHFSQILLPENIGIAHSTIKYQQQQTAV